MEYVKYVPEEPNRFEVFDPSQPVVVSGEREDLEDVCDYIIAAIDDKTYLFYNDLMAYMWDACAISDESKDYGWEKGDWINNLYIEHVRGYIYRLQLPSPTKINLS